MKAILLTLLIASPLWLKPCDRLPIIKKAVIIVDNVIRRSKDTMVDAIDADHALRVYYGELDRACDECQALADLLFSEKIDQLEKMFNISHR